MNPLIADAPVLSAAEMRAAEQACFDGGVAQIDLMERAGRAVAREAQRFSLGRAILVLAGPGNNGGDAYVAARHLRDWGRDVSVAAMPGNATGAAAAMRARWEGVTVALDAADPRPVIVDGVFGTALSRPLAGEIRTVLHRLVDAAEFSLAIDLPSGIDTDSGADFGAPQVSATLALGAVKPAHLLMPGSERCGAVLLADIGIACRSDARVVARPRLRMPARDSHKYSRGLVVVVAGAMPGASRLAARAALHGGAGYVMLAGKDLASAPPDALVTKPVEDGAALGRLLEDERIASVVVGPGLGRDAHARSLLDAALAAGHALILDGDALTLLGRDAERELARRTATTILTPHAGEFARMFDSGDGDKLSATRAAARATGATLIHKGSDTVVARPDGTALLASGSSPWLSTAGTGDVLAGLCGARVAVDDGGGAGQAVWLHARAGRLAGPAFAADDLIAAIPMAMGECL